MNPSAKLRSALPNLGLALASIGLVWFVGEVVLRAAGYAPLGHRPIYRISDKGDLRVRKNATVLDCYPSNPRGYFGIDLREPATRDAWQRRGLAGLEKAAQTFPFCVSFAYNAQGFRVAALIRSSGGCAGTRCAILADNGARWCATYLGILRLGAVAVPLDTAYSAAQVRTVVADSAADFLFTTERHLATAREAIASITLAPAIILMAGLASGGLAILDDQPGEPAASQLPPCAATPADTAVILYTSGTTSDPKGVVLTHGNLLSEKDAVFRVVTVNEQDSVLGGATGPRERGDSRHRRESR